MKARFLRLIKHQASRLSILSASAAAVALPADSFASPLPATFAIGLETFGEYYFSPGSYSDASTQQKARKQTALVMVPPAWLSTITGVSNQLISGSEP
jgi:hypothetical protein